MFTLLVPIRAIPPPISVRSAPPCASFAYFVFRMSMSTIAYSSHYSHRSNLSTTVHLPTYRHQHRCQDHTMSHHDQAMSQSQLMQPPPSPSIPIDPALALYPPYYPSSSYQQAPHHLPPHLTTTYSSPSSQGSDTLGTPPTEHAYPPPSYVNGKRPASTISNGPVSDSRKKPRKDDGTESTAEKDEPKAKPTRGSR